MMDEKQEMLVEKYTFTKAPAGPHHNNGWLCIDCKSLLSEEHDFYPYCILCRTAYCTDEELIKAKVWIVKTKKERGLL
jgi:hypothetical protein